MTTETVRYQAIQGWADGWECASPLMPLGPWRQGRKTAYLDTLDDRGIPRAHAYITQAWNWREVRAAQKQRGVYPWPV